MIRKNYPEDNASLPSLKEEKPYYFVEYIPGSNEAKGWFIYSNRENLQKTYLFQTYWVNAKPYAKVSIASLKKGYQFSDRDYSREQNNQIRDIIGAPENQLKDQRERAKKLGNHIREKYIADQDFLIQQLSSGAKFLETIVLYRLATEYYQDDQWLISCRTSAKGKYYAAEFIGPNATNDKFLEKIRYLKQQAEEANKEDEKIRKHLYINSDDD